MSDTLGNAAPDEGSKAPPVPPVALRTYTAIRVGVVAVILALGFAVWREIVNSPQACVQRSLSAYYYTPVRPMFVGALLVIGFAMIVMWGKTAIEDATLNLAGLLLIVVAFVPTLDANYCSIRTSAGRTVSSPESKQIADNALIQANAATVARSFSALLFMLWVLLIVIPIAGWITYRNAQKRFEENPKDDRRPNSEALRAYVITWVLSLLVVIIYTVLYQDADNLDSAFNHKLHAWSANIAVVLIIVAVGSAARQKAKEAKRGHPAAKKWSRFYAAIAVAMALAALIIKGGDTLDLFSGWWDDHATFMVEAILIGLLGIFWSLQTIDRRNEGAPNFERAPAKRPDTDPKVQAA
ncbi:hypothetical protein [Nocardioides sp.]|uniref:hypothetical protein n=1 Tax=Nocardioides sp. TaxID=35761 RepID=UPI002F42C791